ncbi:DUF2922 domain-containing protein [Rossellomorea vietnamensis]|uniref:DUF2922 domain-containing protein n=1 Tax=Rossellomorea vietnamensis TaxID=218284 RepID=A0A5D4NVI7_9BACI|nr:DUF2922 domain-containing protein [Rossellomorea vietnamensis]TYS17691.1 DUF2922 domain-containing protein [Rossellomorea vietnamensis]
MAKALELQFITQLGKTARVSIDAPIEPVDTDQVKQVMDTLIATNVIQSSSGPLVTAEGARVIERNVTEYEV